MQLFRWPSSRKSKQVVDDLPDEAVGLDLLRTELFGGQQCRQRFTDMTALRVGAGKVEVEAGLPFRG